MLVLIVLLAIFHFTSSLTWTTGVVALIAGIVFDFLED